MQSKNKITATNGIDPFLFGRALESMISYNDITSDLFAKFINTSPSSIIHLRNGRNAPSLEFVSLLYKKNLLQLAEIIISFEFYDNKKNFYDSIKQYQFKTPTQS